MSAQPMKIPSSLAMPQIITALRERYASPEWAFLEQVRSRTGYGGPIRTADALAMNLYPGRGMELHGFEIKVDRQDVKRELKDPDKAEEIQRFCDRWWFVVGDAGIIRDGELPPTWGLLAPDPNTQGKLRIAVPAPKLEAQPLSKAFVAAVLRNVAQAKEGMVMREEVADLLTKAREEGRELAINTGGSTVELNRVRGELERLEEMIAKFREASGVELLPWNAGDVGHAVKLILACGVDGAMERVRRHQEWILKEAKDFGKRIAKAQAGFTASALVPEEPLIEVPVELGP